MLLFEPKLEKGAGDAVGVVDPKAPPPPPPRPAKLNAGLGAGVVATGVDIPGNENGDGPGFVLGLVKALPVVLGLLLVPMLPAGAPKEKPLAGVGTELGKSSTCELVNE